MLFVHAKGHEAYDNFRININEAYCGNEMVKCRFYYIRRYYLVSPFSPVAFSHLVLPSSPIVHQVHPESRRPNNSTRSIDLRRRGSRSRGSGSYLENQFEDRKLVFENYDNHSLTL
jgi:hypothetical protein